MPSSDHWLARNHTVRLSVVNKQVVIPVRRIVVWCVAALAVVAGVLLEQLLACVAGASILLALDFFAPGPENAGTGLTDLLPSSGKGKAARNLLSEAIEGRPDALDAALSCKDAGTGPVEVALPDLDYSWAVSGPAHEREAAIKALTKLSHNNPLDQ